MEVEYCNGIPNQVESSILEDWLAKNKFTLVHSMDQQINIEVNFFVKEELLYLEDVSIDQLHKIPISHVFSDLIEQSQ